MKKTKKIARFAVSLAASLTMLAAGMTASAAVYGDVDNSGSVSAIDASLILRHAVGVETLSGDALRMADVDGDGAVTAIDASLILRKSVGAIETFPAESLAVDNAEPDSSSEGKTLVVYYSATGSTRSVAEYIASAADADIFEIVPAEPYSSADLNWTDSGSRVVREHDDESLRNVPLASTTVTNWSDYDTVFIGYPIWWGIAAWPTNSFVAANDFNGKTVIPFCTSSSSGIGSSGTLLEQSANGGNSREKGSVPMPRKAKQRLG